MSFIIAQKLHEWAIQELNLASEAGPSTESGLSSIPDFETLHSITKEIKYKRLWIYVIDHVRSKATVDKIKRTLYLKKLMKESEDNVPFNDESIKVAELRAAISKAEEKRTYLLQSLSTVKERSLNLEQEVKNIRDETFQVNQKTALLELLKQRNETKNANLKDLHSQIVSCKNSISAYQTAKVCDETVQAHSYNYLYGNNAIYDQNYSRVKKIINLVSCVYKNNFQKDEFENLAIENIQHNIRKLKENGLILTDIVSLLKEISGSDVQKWASVNGQSLATNDVMSDNTKQNTSTDLLLQMKCDSVHNSLSSVKNRKKIEELLIVKKKVLEDIVKNDEAGLNDSDFELKCTLFEKQAENNALIESNSYMEDYLKLMCDKTRSVLQRISQREHCREELGSLIQTFYKHADLAFFLLYTFSDKVQKVAEDLNGIRSFARSEIFTLPFPEKEYLTELNDGLAKERKLTWDYCDKANVIQSLFPRPHKLLLSPEVQACLKLQPFQNISTLCGNWVQFKQKLREEIIEQSAEYATNGDIDVSDLYARISTMLDTMKVEIEGASLSVDEGMACCSRTKSLIKEWWEQKAQYVPDVEYEGKTLKMWIDILKVLSDFEPPNYLAIEDGK